MRQMPQQDNASGYQFAGSGFSTGGGGGGYVLPVATSETLGGVKVGDGVEVASNGTLSVSDLLPTENKVGKIKINNVLKTLYSRVYEGALSGQDNKVNVDANFSGKTILWFTGSIVSATEIIPITYYDGSTTFSVPYVNKTEGALKIEYGSAIAGSSYTLIIYYIK